MRRGLWWLLAIVVVAVGAVAVVFAVKPSTEQPGVLPPLESAGSATPSESAAVASPTLTEEEQVIDVYRRYHSLIRPTRLAPAAERRGMIEEVVTASYLEILLDNMAAQEADGVTLWGTDSVILDATAKVTGSRAQLVACLDESQGGQVEVATGKHLTVGLPRNPAHATVLRRDDGFWQVDDEAFPGGTC